MKYLFTKYQSAGNDFVIIKSIINIDIQHIKQICDRRFGVGADGLMLINEDDAGGFSLKFFNSDGSTDTLCGNGSLCAVDFATQNFALRNNRFSASDGIHEYKFGDDSMIKILFHNCGEPVSKTSTYNEVSYQGYFINTGSPHFVIFTDNINQIDLLSVGKHIRHDFSINSEGCNVDFVEIVNSNMLKIRTFERGVEDETLGCGTGSVAAAISYIFHIKAGKPRGNNTSHEITVSSKGGNHIVSFCHKNGMAHEIYLGGFPKNVFNGSIEL